MSYFFQYSSIPLYYNPKMNAANIGYLESLAVTLYTSADAQARDQASSALQEFFDSSSNFQEICALITQS